MTSVASSSAAAPSRSLFSRSRVVGRAACSPPIWLKPSGQGRRRQSSSRRRQRVRAARPRQDRRCRTRRPREPPPGQQEGGADQAPGNQRAVARAHVRRHPYAQTEQDVDEREQRAVGVGKGPHEATCVVRHVKIPGKEGKRPGGMRPTGPSLAAPRPAQNVARNPIWSLRASAPSDGCPYCVLASLNT